MSGGTGGHLWPALALAEQLRACGHATSLLAEGRSVEHRLLERAGCEAIELGGGDARGLRRIADLPAATMRSRRALRERAVDVVIGTGGGASVPVALAARSLGLPLFLLEQNAVVGRANRMLRPLARRVYLGLPVEGGCRRGLLTGTPLRPGFGAVDPAAARRALGFDDERPVVLVTGGSLGARVLNQVVPLALRQLRQSVQVVHLTGAGNDADVRASYGEAKGGKRIDPIVRPLAAEMPELFAAADLIVCRGGGCTVSELIAAGRPAVIVPYPHHSDAQQLRNGRLLERVGAAHVLEEGALEPERLAALLDALCADRDRLRAMGERARAVAPQNSAAAIASDLEQVVTS